MRREWLLAWLWVGGASGIGALLSYPWTGIIIGLASYLAWHLFNLRRLVRWLSGDGSLPGGSPGVWGEIYHGLYRLRRRSRRRKKRLRKALKRFRQSTAALPDAIVALEDDEFIDWWNPPAGEWLGLRRQDLGQPISNLLRDPALIHFLREQRDPDEELTIDAPMDPARKLAVRLVDYGKRRRLLVARDITRLQRLEQMRSDFVANVSHELRTPLTVISGYLETLEADPQLPGELKTVIQTMDAQAQRLQNIVSDLLLLSRLENGEGLRHEEDIDMHAMLGAIVEDARVLSNGRHRIELVLESHSGLHGNREELHSAFANLIGNAVRYVPEGGNITVSWREHDDGLQMCVADDGPGIEAWHLPRLTERFYRVDTGRSREQGGTGLGLAIVKHVLLKLNGELRIDSEPGRGSRFCCHFPLSARSGSLS